MGYIIEKRIFSSSASSADWTTGSPSTDSLLEGWWRENRSIKTGDAMASTGLWTRKWIRSDDWMMTFASDASKASGIDVVELTVVCESSRSRTRDRADPACEDVKVEPRKQLIDTSNTHIFEAAINNRGQSFPKVSYGLTGYRHTCAVLISAILPHVTSQGNVELNEIEEVRGISYRCNSCQASEEFGKSRAPRNVNRSKCSVHQTSGIP